jgi:hypothetical protein
MLVVDFRDLKPGGRHPVDMLQSIRVPAYCFLVRNPVRASLSFCRFFSSPWAPAGPDLAHFAPYARPGFALAKR